MGPARAGALSGETALAREVVVTLSLLAALGVPAIIIISISRAGWAEMAETYPGADTKPRPKTRFGYGSIRGWIGYNGALIVTSDARGLYLATWPVLLSWCHPPVFIPWSEVAEIKTGRRLGMRFHELVTRRTAHLRFALRSGTFALVRDDARAAGVRGADPA